MMPRLNRSEPSTIAAIATSRRRVQSISAAAGDQPQAASPAGGDPGRVLGVPALQLVVVVGRGEEIEELVNECLATGLKMAAVDVALEELRGELVDAVIVNGHAGTFSSSKNRHEHRSQRAKAQKWLKRGWPQTHSGDGHGGASSR